MTKVEVSKSINARAEMAWEKLASFRGLEEFSPIERSVTRGYGAGATRTCYLPDGAAINEVMEAVENDEMEMQYRITDGPFPIKGYVSTVKIDREGDDRCRITWSCQFEAGSEVEADMVNLFEGFYHKIIDGLEMLIGNSN